MVELLVALAIAGLLLAVTVPSFKRFQESADLRSGAQAIATQLMVARQKAIATGTTQELRLQKNFGGTSDYHIWSGGVAFPSWRLPANLNYYWGSGTQTSYRMTSDGRCMDSGLVILENSRGARDTISVRVSGLIVVY